MKLIVFGYKRHGKDTTCEFLEQKFGLGFRSSSYFACEEFIFDLLKDEHGYASIDECFEDRVNHRELWYNLIRDYNKEDRTRLGRGIFQVAPVYCGIRDRDEFEALKKKRLFDVSVWIDASERLPDEDESSMNLNKKDADFIITNNGSEAEFLKKLEHFFKNTLRCSASPSL